MDLLAFEQDRPFVVKALRQGEIDYLEPVTEAVEADFFRQLIDRQILDRLAESYPTPRKKQEVPVWLYIASELSLKLNGSQGYHAYPRLLRSGGLIDALGPELGGRKSRHPKTGEVTTTGRRLATRISCGSSPGIRRPGACTPGSTAKCPGRYVP
jgi:hypothetical protein